ncbi:hypothetical protein BsWGS_08865 [Bradybaena similaris]
MVKARTHNMRTGHRQVFMILVVILTSVDTASDCVYQECMCDDNFVSCSSLGLTAIPPLRPPGEVPLTDLQFDINHITLVPAGSLPANLSQITFTDNPIQAIDDNAFIGSANTLQTLALTFAPHSRIPDALLQLKALTFFEVYDTVVGDWNENVMKYLAPKLQSLSLGNVSLPTLPDWIQYCSQMSDLTIVNCFLKSIPDHALDAMAGSLISLSLTGNNLTAVPKAISTFTNITDLYLDSNKITDLQWLPKRCRLDTLALNNNKLSNGSQLSEALKPFAEFLSDLDLVSNELTAIPDLHFLTLTGLDFSFNRISDLNAGSLPPDLRELNLEYNLLIAVPRVVMSLKSLKSLLMASNLLTHVQASTIPSTLQYLGVEHNQVTELTDTSFPENSSLRYLYLNNNPISKISDLAFQNLVKLHELHMSGTRLTRLPMGLSSLHKITTLDVSDISPLVCTCMEKDLKTWIVNMKSENVLGNCGLTSVYNFFSLLSPSCPG